MPSFSELQVVSNLARHVYAAPNQVADILDMQEVCFFHTGFGYGIAASFFLSPPTVKIKLKQSNLKLGKCKAKF